MFEINYFQATSSLKTWKHVSTSNFCTRCDVTSCFLHTKIYEQLQILSGTRIVFFGMEFRVRITEFFCLVQKCLRMCESVISTYWINIWNWRKARKISWLTNGKRALQVPSLVKGKNRSRRILARRVGQLDKDFGLDTSKVLMVDWMAYPIQCFFFFLIYIYIVRVHSSLQFYFGLI